MCAPLAWRVSLKRLYYTVVLECAVLSVCVPLAVRVLFWLALLYIRAQYALEVL